MYPTATDLVFCVRLRRDEKEFAQNNAGSVVYQYVNMPDMRGGSAAFFLLSLALDDRAAG